MLRKLISRIKTWLEEPLNDRALFGNHIRETYQMMQMLCRKYGYKYLGNNFYIVHNCSELEALKNKLFIDAHDEIYEIRNDRVKEYPVLVQVKEYDHEIFIDVLTSHTQLTGLK